MKTVVQILAIFFCLHAICNGQQTMNYIPKYSFTPPSTLNSLLYDNGTTVGLGPGTNFHCRFHIKPSNSVWEWGGLLFNTAIETGTDYQVIGGNGGAGLQLTGTKNNNGYPSSQISLDAMYGNIIFGIGVGISAPTTKMTVNQYGLTIGTSTNPTGLTVLGNSELWGWLAIHSSDPLWGIHEAHSGSMTGTTYGLSVAEMSTSSTPNITRYGAEIQATGPWNGTGATNIGLHVNASGGTINYGAIIEGGNVGIGTTSPTALLHTVASGSQSASYTGNLLTNVATSSATNAVKYGVEIQSTGTWNGSGASNIGLHVMATGGANNYAARFDQAVGIGANPCSTDMLAVNGQVHASSYITNSTFCDFVFDQGYKLMPLEEVEQHINADKHLPGIPSAREVEEKGLNLGDMEVKMMQKVEELTLYVINQHKELKRLQKENEALKLRVSSIGK
ncbi:MAG TPA: hypothetical protein VI215_03615 [Bacteroidota bacterium]